jgi:hypothetical protein
MHIVNHVTKWHNYFLGWCVASIQRSWFGTERHHFFCKGNVRFFKTKGGTCPCTTEKLVRRSETKLYTRRKSISKSMHSYKRQLHCCSGNTETFLLSSVQVDLLDCLWNDQSLFVQANLPYKLNKPVYSRRKFRVTIYPGNDNILIMAMIMTFLVQK